MKQQPYPLAHRQHKGYVLHKSRTMYIWSPKVYERYVRWVQFLNRRKNK